MFFKHFWKPDFLLPLGINAITFVDFIFFFSSVPHFTVSSLLQRVILVPSEHLNLFVLPIILPVSSHTSVFLPSGVRSCFLSFLTLIWRSWRMAGQSGREEEEMLILLLHHRGERAGLERVR